MMHTADATSILPHHESTSLVSSTLLQSQVAVRKLGSAPIARLVSGLLLVCIVGCAGGDPDKAAPTITASEQSAASALAGQSVTFSVTAQDAQTAQLHFSWTASAGTLGEPSSTDTTSQIAWTAPLCTPNRAPVTVTVTVMNDGGFTTKKSFSIPGNACPSPTVAASDDHSLALRANGTVWAWGNNDHGQLGDGTKTDRLTPVQLFGLTHFTALAAGDAHVLALRGDNTIWAWGSNGYGQLGDGSLNYRTSPVQTQFP
jgi:hypothetical protein